MIVNLISGVDKNTKGIGVNGSIPWSNKEDMKWFKKLTTGHACVMGWTTFISFKKPLENRLNIVVSQNNDATTFFKDAPYDNVRNARSIEDAIEIAKNENHETAFVIGGCSIYKQYLEKDLIDTMYIDFIDNSEETLTFDTFFPYESIQNILNWESVILGYGEDYKNEYVAYHKIRTSDNNVDEQYLDLLNKIKKNGQVKHTRSGDTISIFGNMLRFDAFLKLPILTTKKIYTKGCIHELLWFIKGDTNIRYLVENDVHIWDDDAYRYYMGIAKSSKIEPVSKEEFLNGVILGNKICDYTYGDLGPIYGKQWNDWNGINQIKELVERLKTNPDDRRMMISSWNVGELEHMALPPCHYNSQWYVTKLDEFKRKEYENKFGKKCPEYGLSVMWNQRSVDTCLGLPYNILSYSIFLNMVAQCVGMVPYEVICNLGDTHVYKNQIDSMDEQLMRNPYRFELPTLHLTENIKDIYEFTYDDIKIENYESYPAIKYKLSVGL